MKKFEQTLKDFENKMIKLNPPAKPWLIKTALIMVSGIFIYMAGKSVGEFLYYITH